MLTGLDAAGRARALADIAGALGVAIDPSWIITPDDLAAVRQMAPEAAERARLEDHLDSLRARLEQLADQRLATTGVDPLDELLLEAVADDLAVRRAAAQAVVTALDPAADTSRRDQIQGELARIERQLADLRALAASPPEAFAGDAEPVATEIADLERELTSLEERRNDLADALASVPDIDDVDIEPGERGVAGPAVDDGPNPLLELADRCAGLRARIASQQGPAVPAWLIDQTRAEIEEAKADVNRLEVEQMGGRISIEDAAALEAAHAAAEETEQKARGRFANPLAKRRAEAARLAEREILDRLNLASYATFVLQHASGAVADPAIAGRLAAARARLEDAESVWETLELHGRPAEYEDLSGEEQSLRVQASLLLAEEIAEIERRDLAAIEELLRAAAATAPAAPSARPEAPRTAVVDAERARLVEALHDLGAEHARAVAALAACRQRAAAEATVATSAQDDRRRELEARADELEQRAAELRAELDEPDRSAADVPDPGWSEAGQVARSELQAIEHEEQLLLAEIERLASVRAAHGIVGADAEAAAEQLEHEMFAVAGEVDECRSRLDTLTAAMDEGISRATDAILRACATDASVLVLDDAFRALPPALMNGAMATLSELAAVLPVVYLTVGD